MNTFPIKYVEANKAFRQFKVLGNQINKNISIIRVFLETESFRRNTFKVFDSVGHSNDIHEQSEIWLTFPINKT